MKLAQGGSSWIAASLLITLVFGVLSALTSNTEALILFGITAFFALITLLLMIFFRDPDRTIADGIVCPADGYIRERCDTTDAIVGTCVKISIFMNIHNVHVNRMPFDGTIREITHIPGGHIPAFTKESDRNERVITILDTVIGPLKLVQIAGTLARRIVPYVGKGDTVKKGERIGLIRLGSRVDLYLPKKGIRVLVNEHDRVTAGADSIAEINA